MYIFSVNTVSQIYQIYPKLPMKMKFLVKVGVRMNSSDPSGNPCLIFSDKGRVVQESNQEAPFVISLEWESQVLLTDGQVVFLRVLRFSPTFDERSARYK